MKGINSYNKDSICISCYQIGERKDSSAVKYLLNGINDPRISHHIRYYGMSVYYCRAIALNKISGLNLKIDQASMPDMKIINKFIQWALKEKLILSEDSIRISHLAQICNPC
jgi:hypothetical protein